MNTINNILRIDASARKTDSITRSLADEAINHFAELGAVNIVTRDVAQGLPFVDEEWIGANFTPDDARTDAQRAKLSLSNQLVDELVAADTIIIATPIYNFSVPASLKAWVDMVARVHRTFHYTDQGPVGLLENKCVIVFVASGGTNVGSAIDFATPYLKFVLGFMGITNVQIIAADAMSSDAEQKRKSASEAIKALQN
ncbi:MAG: FMN-dependent NADH-azoreductase [Robiginitomaculum sp.]|nr:MAG: FMN-dependent NADH-azoreductase [Robiginitomaculum sp.]